MNDAVESKHVSLLRFGPVGGGFIIELQEKNRSMSGDVSGTRGVAKKISISASGVTLKYSPEVPEPTIALYVCRDPSVFTTRVIRKDRLASIPFVIVVRTT